VAGITLQVIKRSELHTPDSRRAAPYTAARTERQRCRQRATWPFTRRHGTRSRPACACSWRECVRARSARRRKSSASVSLAERAAQSS
jgi:hypothetical protein